MLPMLPMLPMLILLVARAACPGRPWSGRRRSSGSSVGFVGSAPGVGETNAAVADALLGEWVEVSECPAAVVDDVVVGPTQQAQVPQVGGARIEPVDDVVGVAP